MPRGRLSFAALAVSAAITRAVRVKTGSITGGGESLEFAWRFWPHRPRVAARIEAPAPWGGVWAVQAYSERQPFNIQEIPRAEQTGGRLSFSNWAAARWQWTFSAGLDEWSANGTQAAADVALQFVSRDERFEAGAEATASRGDGGYATVRSTVRARSSTAMQGVVFIASGGFDTVSRSTPLHLWAAGDTGHVRRTLLRAHPVLDDGRLRVERLGRLLVHGSFEAQRWWRAAEAVRVAAAAFSDVGRTASRFAGGGHADVDIGLGARLAVAGIPGSFRADLGKGLRDGSTALSLVFEP
jgi:hypothetical protein